MLRIMVFYDIQDDRLRNRVCEICLDYGFERQQYSIFVGFLKARQLHALTKELCHHVQSDAYVIVLPVSLDDWEKRIEIGSPIHVS